MHLTDLRLGTLFGMLGIGLLLGVLCLVAGYLVVGMGHGWDLPANYGFLSLILYTLAMARWGYVGRDTAWSKDAALTSVLAVPLLWMFFDMGLLPPPLFPPPAPHWLDIATAAAAYLLAGYALRRSRWQAAFGDGALLAIGIALDVAAVAEAVSPDQLRSAGGTLFPWLPLWLGWQAIAAAALVRHLRARV